MALPLSGVVFTVDSSVPEGVSDLIQQSGGTVKRAITAATKYLISTIADIAAGSSKVTTAEAKGVPVLKDTFITACVAAGGVDTVNVARFALTTSSGKRVSPTTSLALKADDTAPKPAKKAAKTRTKQPKASGASSSPSAPPPAASAPAPAPVTFIKPPAVSLTPAPAPALAGTSVKGQKLPVAVDVADLVDSACGLKAAGSTVFTEGQTVYDFTLTQIDLSKNMDKYYVGQIIEVAGATPVYYMFTRWGRSGQRGQCQQEGPFTDVEEAKKSFCEKFHSKTGNDWDDRATFRKLAGKYSMVTKQYKKATKGKWQYHLAGPQDGKPAGWHDYEAAASDIVEDVYQNWQDDKTLNVRCVQSGRWMYRVDFDTMSQTNVIHPAHTTRSIRRVEV